MLLKGLHLTRLRTTQRPPIQASILEAPTVLTNFSIRSSCSAVLFVLTSGLTDTAKQPLARAH